MTQPKIHPESGAAKNTERRRPGRPRKIGADRRRFVPEAPPHPAPVMLVRHLASSRAAHRNGIELLPLEARRQHWLSEYMNMFDVNPRDITPELSVELERLVMGGAAFYDRYCQGLQQFNGSYQKKHIRLRSVRRKRGGKPGQVEYLPIEDDGQAT